MEKKEILETLVKAKEGCQKYDELVMRMNNQKQRLYDQQLKVDSFKALKTIGIFTIGGLLVTLWKSQGVEGFGALVGFVLGIAFVIYRKKSLKQELNEISQAVNTNIASIQEEMDTVVHTYRQVLSIVPDDYWYTQAMSQLIKYFQQERVDKISDALQLLDEQIHRWKLEDQNSEILDAQQQHAEYLRSIEANSKSAAIGAWANVGATLFSDRD